MNHLIISVMGYYHIIFERIFALFGKGASVNPSHEKLDGAVISVVIFCSLLFINTLTLFLAIDKILDYEIEMKPLYGLLGMLTLIILNLTYFLSGKRYLRIKTDLSNKNKHKRKTESVVVLMYSILSIVLFFILL